MDVLATLGLLLGASWAVGINLYAAVFVLGLADRLGWITLPGSLDAVSGIPVVTVAGILYTLEFVADKIPGLDTVWDAVHTFIRPLGGAALAYLAVGDASPTFQVLAALLGGTLALNAHATKATSRVLVNTSPEPVSNWVASLIGDGVVVTLIWLAVAHPLAAVAVVVVLVVASIWFLRRMWRLVRSALGWRTSSA